MEVDDLNIQDVVGSATALSAESVAGGDAARTLMTGDEVKNGLMKMSRLCGRPEATGNMMTMDVGVSSGLLPDDLWLNNVPNTVTTREHFYDRAVEAVESVLRDKDKAEIASRMSMTILTPELNPMMDSYRIGTLLEMVREIATKLACSGLRVRVCVQGPMGRGVFVGLPLSLNGVRKLLELMDWQSGPGENLEGMVAEPGEPEAYVRFGAVGADEVDKDKYAAPDDVFIVIAPQNIIGFSILDDLREMIEAADGRPLLIINPKLDDIQSSEDTMSVRGRSERLAFVAKFHEIFFYDTLYPSPSVYFPIVGGVCKNGPREPYVVFRREECGVDECTTSDVTKRSVAALSRARSEGLLTEVYRPMGSFDERPTDKEVTTIIGRSAVA